MILVGSNLVHPSAAYTPVCMWIGFASTPEKLESPGSGELAPKVFCFITGVLDGAASGLSGSP